MAVNELLENLNTFNKKLNIVSLKVYNNIIEVTFSTEKNKVITRKYEV